MLAASAIALTLTVPDRAWAQSQMTARDVLALARQLSTAGDLASAESTYLEILTAYPDAPRDVRGAAYFGRAFAAQQRLDEGSGTTPLDTILSYYAQAKELSRRSTRIAADNNSGLALQSAGRFADAVRYFNAAAREVSGAERAQYLMNAGRAHEAAESWSDASRSYERALDADTTASEALRGLLRVLMHAARADLVLDKMDRWRNDSINAAVVVQAIPELMLRERMALNTAEIGRALVYLGWSIPLARTSPSTFNVTLRDRLARVAPSHRQVAAGIEALTDAFAVRTGDARYLEPEAARWWRTDFGGAQAAWSGLLRWLGDWHLAQNETAVARSFYEAAIARSDQLRATWVDRRALLPLALIYSETDPQNEARLNQTVSQFTEIMFSGKAAAYQRGDLEQIREFHTALGAY
jgi:tetratricopeptide (TPR) repeat protein